jgi:hypothetical protein
MAGSIASRARAVLVAAGIPDTNPGEQLKAIKDIWFNIVNPDDSKVEYIDDDYKITVQIYSLDDAHGTLTMAWTTVSEYNPEAVGATMITVSIDEFEEWGLNGRVS